MKIDPQVRRASLIVAAGVLVCSAVMQLIYLIVTLATPLTWHYSFVLGNVLMGVAVTLNFFLMSLSVQHTVAAGNADNVRLRIRLSYALRSLMMLAVLIVSFVFRQHFHIVATVITVSFPQLAILVARKFIHEEEPVAPASPAESEEEVADAPLDAGGEEEDG